MSVLTDMSGITETPQPTSNVTDLSFQRRLGAMGKPKAEESFSNRLSRLMQDKKVTIRSLSEATGVPRSTIQDWRSGVQPTDFVGLRHVARYLGSSLSHLLTGEDDDIANSPSVSQVFKEGEFLFDGFAKISIQRLIPRNNSEPE